MESLIEEILQWGKIIYERGLVSGRNGSISARVGDFMYITKRDTPLFMLKQEDIMTFLISKDEKNSDSGIDVIVHREIYRNSKFNAIIKVYPLYCMVYSTVFNQLETTGLPYKLTKNLGVVPVLKFENIQKLVHEVVRSLGRSKLLMIHSYGVLSTGFDLRECFNQVEELESFLKFKFMLKLGQGLQK